MPTTSWSNILVATAPIPAGTTAQQASDLGAIDTREYLAKSVEGLAAMSDISAIATKVALAPIAVGEPILATQFGDLARQQRPADPGRQARRQRPAR